MSADPMWIELEGAANVRDVGGLPTVDGRATRPGVLLRADNLQDLTDTDVKLLVDELGVRTVLDLRSTGEAHLTGPGPLRATGVTHHSLSLIPEWDGEPDRAEVERAVDQVVEHPEGSPTDQQVAKALPTLPDYEERAKRRSDPRDLTDSYIGYVEQAGPAVAQALRLLADPDSGPTLVHCAAGKDRTGVIIALALSLAGVPRDEIVADYVRSAERAERILARLQATSTYGPSLAGVTPDDIRPRASSIERFLDHVDREYGGAHGLAMSLGVDEETVARLCARLVGTSPHARESRTH